MDDCCVGNGCCVVSSLFFCLAALLEEFFTRVAVFCVVIRLSVACLRLELVIGLAKRGMSSSSIFGVFLVFTFPGSTKFFCCFLVLVVHLNFSFYFFRRSSQNQEKTNIN